MKWTSKEVMWTGPYQKPMGPHTSCWADQQPHWACCGPTEFDVGPVQKGVHNVFHVSNLKKCLSDETLAIPLEEIQIDEQLHFIEKPVEIMDRELKKLKHSKIPIVKVRWNSWRGPEYTWEREDQMKKKYPHLFSDQTNTDNTN
ncbi:hypothetical protein E3N88_20436 [Mikania micrantha]|uniref:Chromo domain-containing protein n=1 Tax=Mikania micrantha TaxID=192012 RepID=A0A5N6NIU7_9ASTR|nr:hypothetical protein E3N88_20436 [Mikania micrantha]